VECKAGGTVRPEMAGSLIKVAKAWNSKNPEQMANCMILYNNKSATDTIVAPMVTARDWKIIGIAPDGKDK
jgi:hypothetical protein